MKNVLVGEVDDGWRGLAGLVAHRIRPVLHCRLPLNRNRARKKLLYGVALKHSGLTGGCKHQAKKIVPSRLLLKCRQRSSLLLHGRRRSSRTRCRRRRRCRRLLLVEPRGWLSLHLLWRHESLLLKVLKLLLLVMLLLLLGKRLPAAPKFGER